MHMAHHWVQRKTYTQSLFQPVTSNLHTTGQKPAGSFIGISETSSQLHSLHQKPAGSFTPSCHQCDISLVTANTTSTSNRSVAQGYLACRLQVNSCHTPPKLCNCQLKDNASTPTDN